MNNHMLKKKLLRLYLKMRKKTPEDVEMVRYWKHKINAEAVYTTQHGKPVLKIEGEKYPTSGIPRGHLLDGKLSKLKHEIKNQIFNDAWAQLERNESPQEIAERIKIVVLPNIYSLFENHKYDCVPKEELCPAVEEIYRAWTKVGKGLVLRDIMCHILQEDDSYRFRVQWLADWFPWWFRLAEPAKVLNAALCVMEHAEVIDDMKERIRLLRRILIEVVLRDKEMRIAFNQFFTEANWRKVKLTKADRYYFRGKYFKVDYGLFDY